MNWIVNPGRGIIVSASRRRVKNCPELIISAGMIVPVYTLLVTPSEIYNTKMTCYIKNKSLAVVLI